MHSEMQQALHEHSRCQEAPPARLGSGLTSIASERRPCSLLVAALPSPALSQLSSPALPQLSRRSGEPSHFSLTQVGGELLCAIVLPGRAAVATRYRVVSRASDMRREQDVY